MDRFCLGSEKLRFDGSLETQRNIIFYEKDTGWLEKSIYYLKGTRDCLQHF